VEIVRKPVYPVKGRVFVNGQPAQGVELTFFPVEAQPGPNTVVSHATTDGEGWFNVSTYGTNDGAPEGEYKVGFNWMQRPPFQKGGGVDRLAGLLNSPQTSGIQIRVEDKPTELEPFQLKTS